MTNPAFGDSPIKIMFLTNKKIFIIIPAYNEAKNLEILIPEIELTMAKLSDNYKIIVVNDGSTDDTLIVLKKLQKHIFSLQIINLEKNSGQSMAVWEGFRNSKGEIIITMDADLQNDPKDIPKMLKEFQDAHMVCGYRKNRQDNVIKKISSRTANFIRRKTLNSPIIDSACGFKIMRKESLEKIEFFDGVHRFLPDLFLQKGFAVKQIEINHRSRIYGKSKYNIQNRALKAFLDLIKVKKNERK